MINSNFSYHHQTMTFLWWGGFKEPFFKFFFITTDFRSQPPLTLSSVTIFGLVLGQIFLRPQPWEKLRQSCASLFHVVSCFVMPLALLSRPCSRLFSQFLIYHCLLAISHRFLLAVYHFCISISCCLPFVQKKLKSSLP